MLIIVVAAAAYWVSDLLISFGNMFKNTYSRKGLSLVLRNDLKTLRQ